MNHSPTARTAPPLVARTSFPRPFRTVLLALLAAGSAAAAQAQPTQPTGSVSSVKVLQPDAQTFAFTVENPARQRLQWQVLYLDNNLRLVDESNRLLSYGCQLCFRGRPAGRYAVLVRVGRERYRYDVLVQATTQTTTQTTITVPGLAPPTAGKVAASSAR